MRYYSCGLRIQSRGRGIHSYKTIMYVLFINKYLLFINNILSGKTRVCLTLWGQNEWGEKLSRVKLILKE